VRTRDGSLLRIDAGPRTADPLVFASALHAWLAGGGETKELVTVRTGAQPHMVTVTVDGLSCPG
jgi:hypothetical protein